MITSFVRHGVEDYDKWRQGYEAALPMLKENGVLEESVHRDRSGNAVIVTHKFKDMDAANRFFEMFSSEEFAAQLQELGVQQPVTVWLGEDV